MSDGALKAVISIVVDAAALLLSAVMVMLLWKPATHGLGLPEIDYWQSLTMNVVCRHLFTRSTAGAK